MELTNLKYLGLTEGETKLYQTLLEHGPLPANQLIALTKLKKGDSYNKLYALQQRGLIEEYSDQKKKHFRLVDPRRLEELMASQYQTAIQAKREIESALPLILSTYTMSYHKPGIVLFEGEEAQRRILEDSLTAESDILQYVDIETTLKLYPDVSQEFARKRAKLQKKKRIIAADSPVARAYAQAQDPKLTQVRLIDYPLPHFSSVMQIYNHKISYFTLQPKSMIGVIIEDRLISQMHRAFFEFTWQQAKSPTGN